MQIRIMKKRDNVEKVPCPYGRTKDTGMTDDKGVPIVVPVYVWPRFAPKTDVAAA